MIALPIVTITPPNVNLCYSIQHALSQPVHIQRGQLAMDMNNAAVRHRLLHRLAKERNFAEGQRVLRQYSMQVWRGLALKHHLIEAGIAELG